MIVARKADGEIAIVNQEKTGGPSAIVNKNRYQNIALLGLFEGGLEMRFKNRYIWSDIGKKQLNCGARMLNL